MSPSMWNRSTPSVEQQAVQQSPPSAGSNNHSNNTRQSTGSDTSIHDIEAAFLPGEPHGERSARKYPRFFPLPFVWRKTPSSNDSFDEKAAGRALNRFRWATIVLSVILLALIGTLLGLEIPHHAHKITSGVELIVSRWGLPSLSTQRDLTNWPNQFTHDVTPIPCHSHNDYWRRVPLYNALAAGCTGVEADIWFDPTKPDDLFVGHNKKSLTPARTLKAMYIDPLLTILNNQNPNSNSNFSSSSSSSSSTNDTTSSSNTKLGIFDTSPTTPLTLLIDLKTPSLTTFPPLLRALQPLLSLNYLTTYNPLTNTLTPGPITIVATGATNFSSEILSPANTLPVRYVFFDAPLPRLSTLSPTPLDLQYNNTNSYYASVSYATAIGRPWLGRMTQAQVVEVRRMVAGARERGLVSRYWDTPVWPRGVEEGVWGVLAGEGVGVLSVDDLVGVRGWWWEGFGKRVPKGGAGF
ncbi:hypothetical protein Q9189_006961 [Teloschistes chrysophthalmus]